MAFLGVVLFAFGILVSLCLHELGHLGTARAFGMRVTRYFVGFGPTLWSFRRGGTEYGLKAIPAGAFVRIAGMTPDDDVDPGDRHRALWRYPAWKKTVVMGTGAVTNVLLGMVLLWVMFAFVPLPDAARLEREPVRVESVVAGSAAESFGLRVGDVVTAVDGQPVHGWTDLVTRVRAGGGGQLDLAYDRGGQHLTGTVRVPVVDGAGRLGITPHVPTSAAGPVHAFGLTGRQTTAMFGGTAAAMAHVPQKIPALWTAVTGGERDPETPTSLYGGGQIAGQLAGHGDWPSLIVLLAGLNFLFGMFNLLPLLPLDGGHIAIYWFEAARRRLFARLRRPDPGPVDYYRLAPVTLAAIALFAAFTLLTVAADIVNPVSVYS